MNSTPSWRRPRQEVLQRRRNGSAATPRRFSRRVSQLEKRLGVRLFTRTTRNVGLTEAGVFYYRRTRAALEELDTAAREVTTFGTDPQGVLKASLPVSYGKEVIAPLFPRFISKFPNVRLEIIFEDRIVDLVAEGVAIQSGGVRDSSAVARKIDSFGSTLVASPDYLARCGYPQAPADFAAHACLGFTRHLTWPDWPFVKGDERTVVRPAGPMNSNNAEALLAAALGAQA